MEKPQDNADQNEAVQNGTSHNAAIEPAAFTPLASDGRRRRRRLTIASAAIALLVLVGALALWFTFASRALVVVTEPVDAQVELDGGLRFRLGDSWLVLPGDYRLRVSAPGYLPADEALAVTRDSARQVQVALTIMPGRLQVNTAVPGVLVELDGKPLGSAPATFSGIAPGEYQLRLRHPRYRLFEQTLQVRGRDLTETVDASLEPAWGELRIDSEPSGAQVQVGDLAAGTTPTTLQVLESGETVRISLPGYKTWEKHLSATPGTQQTHDKVVLQPADAVLTLTSSPAGARVTVDQQYRGQTPLTLDLEPGKSHRIALHLAGYKLHEQTLRLETGEDKALDLALAADLGRVRVSVTPANAELFVDGRKTALGDGVLSLPARPHTLEARLAGHTSVRRTITPKPGIEQQLSLTLQSAAQAQAAATPAQITAADGQVLKLFPPKTVTFTMGSSRREQGRRANEVQRDVVLERPFYLALTPVTNSQFKKFRSLHSSSHAGGSTLDLPDQPVVSISWQDAALYCNWLSEQEGLTPFYSIGAGKVTGTNPVSTGYRLPSEAEWEWAARDNNGVMAKFPWGEGFPPPAGAGNYADQSAASIVGRVLPGFNDGFKVSAPVSRFPANGKGLYSMGHNVAEWIHDFYGSEPSLGTRAQRDPLGPENGEFHVIRGASWRHGTITELRLSFRDYGVDKRNDVGFRVARYAR
ncbi:MAG: PEGA domain-containing protein [Pseudomonas sp.]